MQKRENNISYEYVYDSDLNCYFFTTSIGIIYQVKIEHNTGYFQELQSNEDTYSFSFEPLTVYSGKKEPKRTTMNQQEIERTITVLVKLAIEAKASELTTQDMLARLSVKLGYDIRDTALEEFEDEKSKRIKEAREYVDKIISSHI